LITQQLRAGLIAAGQRHRQGEFQLLQLMFAFDLGA
jgi:hypothetical protein